MGTLSLRFRDNLLKESCRGSNLSHYLCCADNGFSYLSSIACVVHVLDYPPYVNEMRLSHMHTIHWSPMIVIRWIILVGFLAQ
jgi:hypothetical protein